MSVTPWEFVNNAQSSNCLDGYNTFLTNRTLSSCLRFYYTRTFDYINALDWSSVPEKTRALITAGLIRQFPRYNYRYVKAAKYEKSKLESDIEVVMIRLDCSENEARTYLREELISREVLDSWKDMEYFK